MAVEILIPAPLRPYAGNRPSVEANGETVDDILNNLTARYPLLRKTLFSKAGELRGFVNVFVNEEDIRFLAGRKTTVHDF